MKHIVYKLEDNLDMLYWSGDEWNKDIKSRKIFEDDNEAKKTAKKVKGSIFPEEEIGRVAKDSFHGNRNLLPYSSVKEYKKHQQKRWELKRKDCTYIGISPEVRQAVFVMPFE